MIATLHFPFVNQTNGENDLRFWNYTYPKGQNSVVQTYTISQGSEPLRFALGGSYGGPRRPDGRAPWEIGVQLLAERWSQYYDRQGVILSTPGTTPSALRWAVVFFGTTGMSPRISAMCPRPFPTKPAVPTMSTTPGWWPVQASRGP